MIIRNNTDNLTKHIEDKYKTLSSITQEKFINEERKTLNDASERILKESQNEIEDSQKKFTIEKESKLSVKRLELQEQVANLKSDLIKSVMQELESLLEQKKEVYELLVKNMQKKIDDTFKVKTWNKSNFENNSLKESKLIAENDILLYEDSIKLFILRNRNIIEKYLERELKV